MRRMYTILHLYLIVAISLHLLWLISNTTKRPTTSEFFQLFRMSAKFFQSAFLAILYHAFKDAPHSLCLAVASPIAFRLTIRINHDLRILRSHRQAKNSTLNAKKCGPDGEEPRWTPRSAGWRETEGLSQPESLLTGLPVSNRRRGSFAASGQSALDESHR